MLIRRAKINDFDKVYHLICQLEEKKFDKKNLKNYILQTWQILIFIIYLLKLHPEKKTPPARQ